VSFSGRSASSHSVNVSSYACNHGSEGKRDSASRYHVSLMLAMSPPDKEVGAFFTHGYTSNDFIGCL